MKDTVSYELLKRNWEQTLGDMENTKLEGVWREEDKDPLAYTFCFKLVTQRGKGQIVFVSLSEYKGKLQVGFTSKLNTKELLNRTSRLVDLILDNVNLLHKAFDELKKVEIMYPKHYISKSILEERKNESKGVKVSDIKNKKELIVNFFEELKCKELPKVNYSDDERRSFEIRGRGSTNLGKLLVELGIAKEFNATKASKSYHTIYFKDDCYNSHLYAVLDQWESFIRNEIGFQDCFSSRYFI